MYRAELHGKLPTALLDLEDLLTSDVVGFFELADRQIFLRPFLTEVLGLAVTPSEASAASFDFWPTLDDGTEPDAIIRVGGWLLLIEAKLRSSFQVDAARPERNQLRRELREGRALAQSEGRTFKLVTITQEPYCDLRRYRDIGRQDRGDWVWCNWQSVTRLLEQTPENQLGAMGRQLLDVLLRRGTRGFHGFDSLGPAPERAPMPLFFDPKLAHSAS